MENENDIKPEGAYTINGYTDNTEAVRRNK